MSDSFYSEENSKYSQSHPNWHVEDSSWKADQVVEMIDRNAMQFTNIAEIGCGAGEILNQLHNNLSDEVHFSGFDISADAIKMAKGREKERLAFFHTDISETTNKYDLLLMLDVFEHVENYLEFLKAVKKNADHFIFHIPLDISVETVLRNRLIFGRKKGGHLHYFDKETALATLTDCGYTIIDHFYTAGLLELPKRSWKSKLAYIPRKLLFYINKDFAAKFFGGFSLMVYATSNNN